ncbi:hypothetical protein ACN20G_07220 [Streptomyces sp. BI20]|uniref:hypothetical protein n=1 Tax=Streptomyces sp. BI20 TaxID=3403460 RepID=UPI003C75A552
MSDVLRSPRSRPAFGRIGAGLVAGVVGAGAWAAWLGWDQLHVSTVEGVPNETYAVWQVLGLGLTVLAGVWATAATPWGMASALGLTAGVTFGAWYDWSDDASGLYMVGVTMLLFGTVTVTTLTSILIESLVLRARRRRGRA